MLIQRRQYQQSIQLSMAQMLNAIQSDEADTFLCASLFVKSGDIYFCAHHLYQMCPILQYSTRIN